MGFKSVIILVFGSQGSGKTLYGTMQGYNYYKKGYKVYSNYQLNYPHEQLDFDRMMDCNYNNAVIILDEAHLWGLDARDGMSKQNKGLVKKFIVQIRKQGVILLCISQQFRQLDVRLRENAEIVIRCKKYALINKRIKEVFQSENFNKDVPIIIETEITNLDTDKTVYKRFIANDYYGLYDTSQVITMIEEQKTNEVKNDTTKTIKKTNKKKVKKTKTNKSSNKKTKSKKKV